MKKAIALLSGGLDSTLAAHLVKRENIDVCGLIFKSIFFSETKGISAAEQLAIPYKIIDISKPLLKILKKPAHGYGSAANPCIDCHLLMLKIAAKIAKDEKFDFVVTGEVLGQRPFSQNKQALETIKKVSGLGEKLIRPLSEKLLSGKDNFLAISGRSRKTQIALAEKFKLTYPQSAGGCILTEKEFAKKFFDLAKINPDFTENDAALLKFGRHFWFGKNKVILGRNHEENKQFESLAQPNDLLIEPANFSGATALIKLIANPPAGGEKLKIVKAAKRLILKYSKKQTFNPPIVFFGSSQESVEVLKIILANKIKVDLVITKPDRPAGRGQNLLPTPLAEYCQKVKIPIVKIEKLDEGSLPKLKFPIGIVAVYGNFIPNSWLDYFSIIINLHPSLLPKYRGAAPVIRAIENSGKKTGVTIFKLVKEMDAGPVIDQIETRIKPDETAGELTKRLFITGAEKLVKILKSKSLFWTLEPQNHTKATFAQKISNEEAEINWQESKIKIFNKIRAFNPYPGAFTFVDIAGKKMRLKIWRAHLEKSRLIPDEVQLEGKSKLSWKQFKENYCLKDIVPYSKNIANKITRTAKIK